MNLLLIFLGGGLGSISRYGIGKLTELFWQGKFPLGTFLANILSCLILGILLYLLKDKTDDQTFIKYFLIVGFCGGFSTFSAFGMDTMRLITQGEYAIAFLNIIISIAFGFSMIYFFLKG